MTRHGLTLRHEGHHAPNDRTVFVASVLFAALVIFNDISKLPAFTQRLP